jgi:hypothetical protein
MLEIGNKGIYIMMINVLRRKQSEPSQDKENVPPSFGHEPTKKTKNNQKM